MKLALLLISTCIVSSYIGFIMGESRYEVNLIVSKDVRAESIRHNINSFDACVKLTLEDSIASCTCSVFDRGNNNKGE